MRNNKKDEGKAKEGGSGKSNSGFVLFWKGAFCVFGVIAFVGGIIVPWFCQMFLPLFCPNKNLSSLDGFMGPASIVVSFLSLGLAVYSIWQAQESSKQMAEALSKLYLISDHVDYLQKEQHTQSTYLMSIQRAANYRQMNPNSEEMKMWGPPADDEDTQ